MSAGGPPPAAPPATARHHRLVREAMPLVEQKAKQLCAKYRGLVEYDDLCTVGKLAAYDSAPRYKEGTQPHVPALREIAHLRRDDERN